MDVFIRKISINNFAAFLFITVSIEYTVNSTCCNESYGSNVPQESPYPKRYHLIQSINKHMLAQYRDIPLSISSYFYIVTPCLSHFILSLLTNPFPEDFRNTIRRRNDSKCRSVGRHGNGKAFSFPPGTFCPHTAVWIVVCSQLLDYINSVDIKWPQWIKKTVFRCIQQE